MVENVWFCIILVGLVLYVTLDGYDLGMGVLAVFQRTGADRRSLLELVSPVWDGNESWILLVAVGLWGGFPAASGGLLPSLYPVVIIMLFSLILRGVSFEMISNASGWPRLWGRTFMAGSLLAGFTQGIVIGTVIQGVHLGAHDRFTGGTFDFLSGFTVLTGLTTVVLYSLAGLAMVKMRSNDEGLRRKIIPWGRPLVSLAAIMIVLTGVLVPVAGASTLTIDQPLRVVLMIGACTTAVILMITAWWSFDKPNHDILPFVSIAVTMAAGAAGLLILFYPLILPPYLTIAEAASPTSSVDFLLGGFGMLVPVVILYNAFAFWVLRPRRKRATAPFSLANGSISMQPSASGGN